MHATAQTPQLVDRGRKSAFWFFNGCLVAAAVLFLILGSRWWFYSDEWDYLATRSVFADPASLFRPHNEHWHTLPTLMYRVLFSIFKLDSYLPYQIPVIALHLGTVVLLRIIIRRLGVGPWIATAAALIYLGFGSVTENIIFAVQVTFIGSLFFGLVHLILADHVGRWQRRDWWAMAAGLVALMCSGVGVTMVVASVVAVFLRRGFKTALYHALPLAGIFLLWSVIFGESQFRPGSLWNLIQFIWIGIEAAFSAITQIPFAGIALALVMAAGGFLIYQDERDKVRGIYAVPIALLVGAFFNHLTSGLGRAGPFGPGIGGAGRYFGLTVAMMLPFIALSVYLIARKGRAVGALALIVLVMGIPGNISLLFSQTDNRATSIDRARTIILALPTLPLFQTAPPDMRPFPEGELGPNITIEFLRRGVTEGWLPAPSRPPSTSTKIAGSYRLSMYQKAGQVNQDDCRTFPSGSTVKVAPGTVLKFSGGFVRLHPLDGVYAGKTITFNPNRGNTVTVLDGSFTLRLGIGGVNGSPQFCNTDLELTLPAA